MKVTSRNDNVIVDVFWSWSNFFGWLWNSKFGFSFEVKNVFFRNGFIVVRKLWDGDEVKADADDITE